MKRVLIALGMAAVLAAPAFAGGVGVYGAYWDTDDAGDEAGVGAKFATVAAGDEVEIRAYPIDLGLVYRFRLADGRVTPYLGGGGTYYTLSDDLPEDTNNRGYENDEFGYFGELGLDIGLPNRSSVFIEALYRTGKARLDGDGLFGLVRQELNLSGVTAHLGLRLNW